MSEFSVHTEIEGDAALATMKITGAMTLSSVSEFLKQLSRTFDLTDKVVVDLSNATEIDGAGLQVLCSSHRSALCTHKEFRIIGQNRTAIGKIATASGQARTAGCEIDTKHICIWIGGKNS